MNIFSSLNQKQKKAVTTIGGPVLVIAGPGSGKCVTNDTVIFTNKGMIKINQIPEFYNFNKTSSKCKSKIISYTKKGERKNKDTSHWFTFKKSKTIKLETKSGYRISGTQEHPILIINKKGNLEYKKLKDFNGDEIIAISTNNNLWGRRRISEDLSYFMGILTGDGVLGLGGGVIGFAEGGKYLPEIFKKLVKALFNHKKVSSYYKKGTGSVTHCFFSVKIKRQLENIGLKMVLSKYKTIPESIMQAPKKAVIAYLQGIFDTEGSASGATVEYTTASEELARQVQICLLNLGIRSPLKLKKVKTYPKNNYWRISIMGNSLRRFANIVGFRYQLHKIRALKRMVKKPTNSNVEVIPYQTQRFKRIRTQILRKYCPYDAHNIILGKGKNAFPISHYFKGDRNPSALQIMRILSFIPKKNENDDVRYLKNLAQNFFFDPVSSVKKGGNRIVYDFTVPITHSFVGNGFINHNTKCLTHRIAYLIKQGIAPNNILAVTFTNKAAQEMKEKITNLVGSATPNKLGVALPKLPHIGTFHAICLRILRQQIDKLPLEGKPNNYQKNFVIYDETDQLSLVKQTLNDLQINPEQFKPSAVRETISRAKDELINWQTYQEQANDYFPQTVSKIYRAYQESLKRANALDFDDLIMLTVQLFEKKPDILEKYQRQWQYILVDEAHDTNLSQYTLTNLLAKKHQNLWLIADPDQCLPGETKIKTINGLKHIDQLKTGDQIIAAGGRNCTCKAPITRIYKKKYRGDLIKIHTKNKNTLTLTPNHILFLRLSLNPNIYYTYLMFRKDKGYRIGITKGSRKPTKNTKQIGLLVRTNQEKADKIWILKVCYSKSEAMYWEYYFSFYYGIPTVIFFTNGRNMILPQTSIDKIYKNIDTEKRADKLMTDLYFNKDFPHFSPQGVSKQNEAKRIKMRVTMFSDSRKTITSPWGLSRISINTSDLKLKENIEKSGFSVRKGKAKDWVTEIARLDYGEIEKISKKIKEIDNRLDVIKTALLTKNKRFIFQPASQAHPTMIIPVEKNGEIIEDEITKVEKIKHKGKVYDLDIKNVHNYIADNFIVHNSIYSWRGADFRNILNFEKDYPQAKVILLEQNYRSSKNILEASHHIINKNTQHKEKNLWTKNSTGPLINIIQANNEKEEGNFLIEEMENLIRQGYNLKDFTVLYRTNAQSRAIEESFLKAGFPYKIIGSVRFYDRKEIKDIFAYLKLIINPNDLVSLKRIINTPRRRLAKFAKNIQELYLLKDCPESLNNFYSLIDNLRQVNQKKPLTDLINFIIKKTDYEKYLRDGTEQGESRWENIKELFSVADKYNKMEPGLGLEKFLEEVTLISNLDEVETNKDLVNLMTMHCAKGLEFPIVFMVGCEEGIFPHSRSFLNPEQMEEERRLCYVGVTRAKEKAYLTFTQQRQLWGQTMINPPSRFLGDIPDHLIEFREYDQGRSLK